MVDSQYVPNIIKMEYLQCDLYLYQYEIQDRHCQSTVSFQSQGQGGLSDRPLHFGCYPTKIIIT